ncbi:hypothetical protein QAD02_020383 [Eretmocerus hayati]|uniref:Uncharacterized protein n=1 Tax=Eretmocerus hayati TaxID=131215 RepID=A0ACC2PM83_9HYME|nr:hypothetical protein QAD02_020383 [Eretmocerus hayati]
MNNKPAKTKPPNIKVESNPKDNSSRTKKQNTRGQGNASASTQLNASSISLTQLKSVSKAKSVPRMTSNILIPSADSHSNAMVNISSCTEMSQAHNNSIICPALKNTGDEYMIVDHCDENMASMGKPASPIEQIDVTSEIDKSHGLEIFNSGERSMSNENNNDPKSSDGVCGIVEDASTVRFSIDGVVKTAPRLQSSTLIASKIVGGITNGTHVVEINLPKEQRVDSIMKGDKVRLVGAVITKTHGLHVIKVSEAEDIIKIADNEIQNLKYFLNANSHI